MQTKVMECKSHNIAIHLFSNGANDDVFYLRGAANRACLGNMKFETQRMGGWPDSAYLGAWGGQRRGPMVKLSLHTNCFQIIHRSCSHTPD